MTKLIVILLAACSSPSPKDDCARVVEKMESASGRQLPASMRSRTLSSCRANHTYDHPDPLVTCVLGAAPTEEAVGACVRSAQGR